MMRSRDENLFICLGSTKRFDLDITYTSRLRHLPSCGRGKANVEEFVDEKNGFLGAQIESKGENSWKRLRLKGVSLHLKQNTWRRTRKFLKLQIKAKREDQDYELEDKEN